MQIWLNILTLSYLSVGIVGALAYWPTIKDLYKYKKPSANLTSYVIWTFTTGITFLYSIFVLPDIFFRIVSLANFISCAIVLFLRMKI
jgi:hypothetical protein